MRESWIKHNLPLNTPLDVARHVIQVSADPKAHGKALFVSGGKAVDIEEGLNQTEPQWLGEKHSHDLNEGQVVLGLVSFTYISLRQRWPRTWNVYADFYIILGSGLGT